MYTDLKKQNILYRKVSIGNEIRFQFFLGDYGSFCEFPVCERITQDDQKTQVRSKTKKEETERAENRTLYSRDPCSFTFVPPATLPELSSGGPDLEQALHIQKYSTLVLRYDLLTTRSRSTFSFPDFRGLYGMKTPADAADNQFFTLGFRNSKHIAEVTADIFQTQQELLELNTPPFPRTSPPPKASGIQTSKTPKPKREKQTRPVSKPKTQPKAP